MAQNRTELGTITFIFCLVNSTKIKAINNMAQNRTELDAITT